jgi:hypothetical protein
MIPLLICALTSTPCRHVSTERLTIPYAELKEDPVTKLLKPGPTKHRTEVLGGWCNDAGQWIEQMHYCPVQWARARYPLVAGEPAVRWKVRKGNSTRTQEVLHVGQQKLSV